MSSTAWPWPADTALDIARRLLQSYRAALLERDPAACAQLDGQAEAFGQGWVTPRSDAVDPDDLMTANEIGALLFVDSALIRKWAHRGHFEKRCAADGSVVYRLGDVLEHQARQRRARAARAIEKG